MVSRQFALDTKCDHLRIRRLEVVVDRIVRLTAAVRNARRNAAGYERSQRSSDRWCDCVYRRAVYSRKTRVRKESRCRTSVSKGPCSGVLEDVIGLILNKQDRAAYAIVGYAIGSSNDGLSIAHYCSHDA